MDRANLVKLILLSLALPAQYFLSNYWANDSSERSEALKNVIQSMTAFKENFLELNSWKKWYFSFVIDSPSAFYGKKVYFRTKDKKNSLDEDEDMALEVFEFRKNLKNFGQSTVTRSPRPNHVLYKVGQVIKHKKLNLYGVIIGWDQTAQVSSDWVERNYNEEEKKILINQPHYLILVDETSQNEFPNKAYVAQDEIEIVVNNRINNRNLKSYFTTFDGGQYLLKTFLRTVYPHD